MVLAYSRQSESVTNLIRDSDKMVYELRRAQNSSMLTLQQNTSPTNPICRWGIYIDNNNLPQTQYILFSDFCNLGTQGQYDLKEESEIINLLKGVVINSSKISSITFVPPEPQVKFDPPSITEGLIEICLETDLSHCFTIHITSAGQIYKK
jgi:hypothetical protein